MADGRGRGPVGMALGSAVRVTFTCEDVTPALWSSCPRLNGDLLGSGLGVHARVCVCCLPTAVLLGGAEKG